LSPVLTNSWHVQTSSKPVVGGDVRSELYFLHLNAIPSDQAIPRCDVSAGNEGKTGLHAITSRCNLYNYHFTEFYFFVDSNSVRTRFHKTLFLGHAFVNAVLIVANWRFISIDTLCTQDNRVYFCICVMQMLIIIDNRNSQPSVDWLSLHCHVTKWKAYATNNGKLPGQILVS